MEVYVPTNTLACQSISSNSGSSTGSRKSTNYSSGDLSMNDLKTCLAEIPSIEGFEIATSGFNLSPGKNNQGKDVLGEDGCKDLDNIESSNSVSEKCFSNCVGFPALDESKSSVDGLSSGEKGQEDDKIPKASELNGCTKSVGKICSPSIPSPTPLKQLVSALKGSREKLGIAPKKQLSVTWAPDVYDPIPTSVSHFPSSANQRYRNSGKRYGKNKQKGGGKSSRGSKSKNKKKQAEKNSGSATKLKPLRDDAVGVNEPQVAISGFNIVSQDSFCGSSFLKESVSNLHLPVTEAT